MAEEEERSQVKEHSSPVPAHGKQPKSGLSTLSGVDHSEEEDTDTNVATAGIEQLVIEGAGGGGGEEEGEEEGERWRELTPAASDASSSGGVDDDDDIALSSLIRCVFSVQCSRGSGTIICYICQKSKK